MALSNPPMKLTAAFGVRSLPARSAAASRPMARRVEKHCLEGKP